MTVPASNVNGQPKVATSQEPVEDCFLNYREFDPTAEAQNLLDYLKRQPFEEVAGHIEHDLMSIVNACMYNLQVIQEFNKKAEGKEAELEKILEG
jgi:hypothetical protein